ncbi:MULTISPECIES: hypothetical protein [Photorhabdus]|nr:MULTISPECIES: hypothetical protein [Photorhabdus]
MTGVNECSQQRGNLKDDGYIVALTMLIARDTPEKFLPQESIIFS